MKPARVMIMGVAVLAAGLAGYLALNITSSSGRVTEHVVRNIQTIDVLVAANGMPIGSRLNSGSMDWVGWPEDAMVDGLIRRDERPDALAELDGAIVRLPIFAGEPLRSEKLVDSSSHIMSSLLPAGKRAISTEITLDTGAGGFILPNDRVDVIMVRQSLDSESFITEIILSNIRVLAIDQRIEENADGSRTAIGTTATLELGPKQAKILAVAQQMAERLTLALRSVADVSEPDRGGAEYLLSGVDGTGQIKIIRAGNVTNVGASN